MTKGNRQPSQDSEMMPGHVVAKVNFSQALIYLRASKRLVESVVARKNFQTGDEGIAYAGDAMMGLVALELGLNAVRWAVANCPAAETRFPAPGLAEMTRFWARISPLRNYLVHFDQRISESPLTSLGIDAAGIHAGSGHAIGFDEWRGWLGVLEPWVFSECMLSVVPTTDPARPPDWVQVPAGEGPSAAEAQLPSPGVVWFGRGLVRPNAHVLESRTLRFPPDVPIWLTARFVRESPADVRLQVTGPDHITYMVQSLGTSTSANIVSMKLIGVNSEGWYSVSLLDEMDQVLATGQFEIRKPPP